MVYERLKAREKGKTGGFSMVLSPHVLDLVLTSIRLKEFPKETNKFPLKFFGGKQIFRCLLEI